MDSDEEAPLAQRRDGRATRSRSASAAPEPRAVAGPRATRSRAASGEPTPPPAAATPRGAAAGRARRAPGSGARDDPVTIDSSSDTDSIASDASDAFHDSEGTEPDAELKLALARSLEDLARPAAGEAL